MHAHILACTHARTVHNITFNNNNLCVSCIIRNENAKETTRKNSIRLNISEIFSKTADGCCFFFALYFSFVQCLCTCVCVFFFSFDSLFLPLFFIISKTYTLSPFSCQNIFVVGISIWSIQPILLSFNQFTIWNENKLCVCEGEKLPMLTDEWEDFFLYH